jgi:hypothetical protein
LRGLRYHNMASSGSALTVIESARISSIIEEALEKLSFLASITPDVMAHRDELSQIVGDEITRIIQEQRGLELRYEELIAQRASLKALSNKATAAPTPNCCVPFLLHIHDAHAWRVLLHFSRIRPNTRRTRS